MTLTQAVAVADSLLVGIAIGLVAWCAVKVHRG